MQLTLLIPDGLLPVEFTPRQFAQLCQPLLSHSFHRSGLLRLLRRASHTLDTLPMDAHCTADEAWLMRRFQLSDVQSCDDPPYATLETHSPSPVFRCDPVHFQLGRDSLTLDHPAQLEITEREALALHQAIAPLLAEENLRLEVAQPHGWYLHGVLDVHTTSLARAYGQNIDPYLPRGGAARRWRRLLNDIQMTWHEHPVNIARQNAGQVPINSVWLHGGGPGGQPHSPYHRVFDTHNALATLLQQRSPAQTESNNTEHDLHVLRACQPIALAADWQRWPQAWQTMLAENILPALSLLERGAVRQLEIVITGDTSWHSILLRRSQALQFWRGCLQPAAALLQRSLQARPEDL